MAVTLKWRQHIEEWQGSGLSQVGCCLKQRINARIFAACGALNGLEAA
jgi:hypothetical protein